MIVCCGEALIDMLPCQTADGGAAFVPVPGGAIFNTAIALGRLGQYAGLFSGLSTDAFGRQLEHTLGESGVDRRYCVYSGRPTTLAFVELFEGSATYRFYDEGSAGRMLSRNDLPVFKTDVKALHAGSISLIPDPCGSTYEALLQREAPARIISFDPNIRPDFIPDPDRHRARIGRIAAISDIIKVSDEDLEWIATGRREEDMIAGWLRGGATVVVVTMGDQGAAAYTRREVVQVAAAQATVVDTVGAGDAFNAGFLSALNQHGMLDKTALRAMPAKTLEQSLAFASRVAAATVARAGANPPWRKELS